MIKHKEASNHTKWEKNLHFISTCTQQYSSTLAWWHTEIKQKPRMWALKKKKLLLTSDWGLRPVSSKLEDQLVTVWSDLHDVASSSHSYKRTMCDKTAEPIELLCRAVRGSVPLGWGESKTAGIVNTGLFMKCSSSLADMWCCRVIRSCRLEGTSLQVFMNTPACTRRFLKLIHVQTNKEFRRFFISALDICGSFYYQNWFNQAAKSARADAGRHEGARGLGTWSHGRC